MPFTPIHMGPGLLIKSLLHSSFSLMIFGWTQIIMDIQPLIVMITGEGHLHGFSHTFIGATLLAIVAGLTGKHLAEFGLRLVKMQIHQQPITIGWSIVFISAFIGSFSHVILDGIMHSDVQPFFPVNLNNPLLQLVSTGILHKICLYSGLIGAAIYYWLQWHIHEDKPKQ